MLRRWRIVPCKSELCEKKSCSSEIWKITLIDPLFMTINVCLNKGNVVDPRIIRKYRS